MAGVGTTGYVAKKLGRNFIMIEINQKYVEATIKRFKSLEKTLL
jgi:DNA modification methylase